MCVSIFVFVFFFCFVVYNPFLNLDRSLPEAFREASLSSHMDRSQATWLHHDIHICLVGWVTFEEGLHVANLKF